jgi:hypothetical protein
MVRRRIGRARKAELARRMDADDAVPAEPWFAPPRGAAGLGPAVRAAAWTALVCGPIALAAVVLAPEPAGRPGPVAVGAPADALGPAGWAERAVAAYVDGDIDAVRAAFPSAPDGLLPDDAAPVAGMRTSSVAAGRTAPGHWGVTVAVSLPRRDAQTPLHRYFAVGVAQTPGGGWVASSLPAEVAGPAGGGAPDLAYESRPMGPGELTETVEQWASAYLTGSLPLDRVLAPGFSQTPLSPAPYAEVEVRSVLVGEGSGDLAEREPEDGRSIDVLASVEGTDPDGRAWPLSYALRVTGRSGRWEVSGLSATPRRAEAPAPTSGATRSAPGTPEAPPGHGPTGGARSSPTA